MTNKQYFDRIYVLNLVNAPERTKLMEEQLTKIFPNDKYKFWETVKKPFINNEVAKAVVEAELKSESKLKLPTTGSYYDWWRSGKVNLMGVIFDCAYNIYSILKVAQVKQYKHICIFEDDFRFIEDTDKIYEYLDNIPENYDLIRFYSSGFNDDWSKRKEQLELKDGQHYISFQQSALGLGGGGIGMLALSQKGIQVYLNYLEKVNFISDLFCMDWRYSIDNDSKNVLNAYWPYELIYVPDYNNEKIKSEVLTC